MNQRTLKKINLQIIQKNKKIIMTIPINSINKQEPDTQVNTLLKENARVRQNNMALKLQIIEARKTIKQIRELIKK
tara:strand:+ start:1747 stop:1974 length:228 start_codon:yes stop_codon:yes gene_type:complete